MNRYEEEIIDIEGKIAYADATGNLEEKNELIEMKNMISMLRDWNRCESLCTTCNRGELGSCFCMPNVVINRKVVKCSSHRGDR